MYISVYPSIPDSISILIVSPTTIERQVHTSSSFLRERNTTFSHLKEIHGISFRISKVDLETVTYLQSTVNPKNTIREGETLMLTCTGNIGKPPGKLVWQISFPQQNQPIIYSNETTDVESVPEICAFRGTSNLIVQILAEHFKAKFRCFEESQANISGMYIETFPLDVHCEYYIHSN